MCMEVIENHHLKTENWARIVNPRPKCSLALRSRNSKLLQVLPLFLKSACVPYQLGSIFANPNISLPNCNRNPEVRCNVPKTSITVDVHQFVNHSWVDRQSRTSNAPLQIVELLVSERHGWWIYFGHDTKIWHGTNQN